MPEKYVNEDAEVIYDFRLHRRDIHGIARVSERLSALIERRDVERAGHGCQAYLQSARQGRC